MRRDTERHASSNGGWDTPQNAEYARERTINMNLSPDLANGYFQAYVDRGEDSALDFLTNNCQATASTT